MAKSVNESQEATAPGARLDSWKEIAEYLKRDVRTVQRWEGARGLPIRRMPGDGHAAVYALKPELDAWIGNGQSPEPGVEPPRRLGGLAGAAAIVLIAGVSWWVFSRDNSVQATHGVSGEAVAASASPELVRLTATAGLDTDPALSPNGTQVAYASDRGGASGFDIWVQRVGGGNPLRVTNKPGDETEPSFSPDGDEIVFSDLESGAVNVVGSLGGEPREVVRAQWARSPRFSPDGQWIAYWKGLLPSVVPRGLPGATGSVFVVPASGGVPRQLVPQFASARYPVWSPDSAHILFLGEETDTYDWYVAALGSSTVTKTGAISAFQAAGLTAGIAVPSGWRTRDDLVVFSSNEADRSNIWRILISHVTGLAGGPPQRLTFGTAIERSPSVAASGQIAFASLVEKIGVWRAPLDPVTGAATAAFERVTDSSGNDRLRNVSSDGNVVAFLSTRTRRDEAWIKDLDTGRERQLTHAGADDASLTPNGTAAAFSSSNAGKDQIELIDTDSNHASKLCDDCRVPSDWSSDGNLLLFNRGLPPQLVVRDVSSGVENVLAADEQLGLFLARFSPDGVWVAFHTADAPDVRKIYAIPVSRDQPVTSESWVPVVSDHGCHPNWSPDGSLLYHFSSRDGSFCPWVQRVDPLTKHPQGPPRVVRHMHDPRLRAALGAAAMNDVQAGYFYVTATETTGNVWMLAEEIPSAVGHVD